MIHSFVRLIEALQGNPLSVPVFILLYAGGCFIAPVSLFPVAGGVLFGFGPGLAINLAAALLGASGAFGLARVLGRHRLEPWLRRSGQTHPWAETLENPAPGAFILLRLVGFPPFVITNYLAGLSFMPFRVFLWTSAIGLLPWTFVMTFFSGTFWAILLDAGMKGFRQSLMDHSRPLVAGTAVVVLGAVVGWIYRVRTERPKKPGVKR